jgi:Outer membrane protein beta-barrel domain
MIAIRKILFSFALSWAFLSSYCQQFSIGVKAGPLINWGSFGDKDDKDEYSHQIKPGFYAAGLVFFPMKNKYSFQTEFGFSQRGRRITFNEDTWENNAVYYFADAAMMLRRSFPLNLGPNIPSQWFINIGPHVSYWISGKGKVSAGGSYNYIVVFSEMPQDPPEPDFDKMYMHDVNRWLFGIDFGVGFNAPLKRNRKLSTELRFTSGHTFFGSKTSATNRTLGFMDNLRANEKVISLTIAYTIDVNVKEGRKGKSTKDREVKRKK